MNEQVTTTFIQYPKYKANLNRLLEQEGASGIEELSASKRSTACNFLKESSDKLEALSTMPNQGQAISRILTRAQKWALVGECNRPMAEFQAWVTQLVKDNHEWMKKESNFVSFSPLRTAWASGSIIAGSKVDEISMLSICNWMLPGEMQWCIASWAEEVENMKDTSVLQMIEKIEESVSKEERGVKWREHLLEEKEKLRELKEK